MANKGSLSKFLKVYKPPTVAGGTGSSAAVTTSGRKPYWNVCVLHSPSLTSRQALLNQTLGVFQKAAGDRGYTLRPILLQKPDLEDVNAKWSDIQKKIVYGATGDADFDRMQGMLTPIQMSNFLKQVDALQIVQSLGKDADSARDLHMIMEDDALVLPECIDVLDRFLTNPGVGTWDILFPGISVNQDAAPPSDGTPFRDIRGLIKVLPGKDSYFLTPETAAKVLATFQQPWKFTYRGQLSWFIHTNLDVRARIPNQRFLVEGSKIGVVPSSLNDNNVNIYNHDCMEMYKSIMGHVPFDFEAIASHAKNVDHLQSPDVLHLLALAHLKRGGDADREKAMSLLEDAIVKMKERQGHLYMRSDILNNLIQLYENEHTTADKLAPRDFTDSKYHSKPFPEGGFKKK